MGTAFALNRHQTMTGLSASTSRHDYFFFVLNMTISFLVTLTSCTPQMHMSDPRRCSTSRQQLPHHRQLLIYITTRPDDITRKHTAHHVDRLTPTKYQPKPPHFHQHNNLHTLALVLTTSFHPRQHKHHRKQHTRTSTLTPPRPRRPPRILQPPSLRCRESPSRTHHTTTTTRRHHTPRRPSSIGQPLLLRRPIRTRAPNIF